ncbi:MAG: cyclic nucleotide-binding domain-containing protein [Candidatus Latescibacteria bacterium]|jgi:CRP/FNR family transcriptional regulator, cyclic AMP receptor protein|nr:cyclic nucleotide-binding domain-containing protein [Candidatus Latescibacterota bacterium]MBT4141407.1 cyclic nucleotide-binding domain-containing protein [Candidatus Latescibacterota bacterium]
MATRQGKQIRLVVDEEWDIDLEVNQQRARDVREVLAEIEIFSDLQPEELRKVGWMLHTRTYLPNEVIVRQGAPGVGMYIIQSGSANVELDTPDGARIHLATLGELQFFGEMSLLDGAPRAASVIAAERTHALGFFRADLMGLIEHAPRLGFKIVWRLNNIMTRRLNETLGEYRQVMRTVREIENQEGSVSA